MKEITRTELVWAGKYDDQGNLRPVERTILPFQVVETVNESKADREKVQRDLWTLMPRDDTWRNMLIWGDNKVVMSSLLPRFAGKINLIYIDPPFATGQDFSFRVRIGDPSAGSGQVEEFVKEPSIIEEKAYRDTWGRGLDSYLQMMYERLVLMRELLAEDGSIYVHLDWRLVHYVRALADEVFGPENFRNDIVWKRAPILGRKATSEQYGRVTDTILFYSKGPNLKFNRPYMEREVDLRQFKWDENEGRYFKTSPRGDYTDESIAELEKQNRVYHTSTGGIRIKYFIEQNAEGKWVERLPADCLWLDIPDMMHITEAEKTGFDTQKPEALLSRIIRTSSNEGDLVADFFCGSGTTLAVAEKLGRRWIGCDLSKWAIQVTRKRLLQIEGCRPFEILNLGNYERHKLAANGHWERYVQFILELYRAEAVTGFRTLHGKKARAYVHVGSVDSPVTMREIRQTLKEAQEASVREVRFLGWDFEMGLHDLIHQVGDDYGVKVRLVAIPRESLEVTNPACEEVRFFDLNYLDLEHEVKGRKLNIRLKDFIIANPEYLPDEVQARIKKFTDYIDYWAVDWDYRGDTFHNGWQSFRTRKDPKLATKATHTYDQPGTYKVLVKVVDIFGNDTTKMVEVELEG